MKRTVFSMFLLCILLLSCEDRADTVQRSQLVVEGWIEKGHFPVVLVTRTANVSDEYQNASDLLVRWAKVTISDGEHEVILIGGPDKNYYPPYRYTSYDMVGEAGKTYTLTIEDRGDTVKAATTIPPSVAIDSAVPMKCADSDTLYQVKVYFKDDPHTVNYYKLFTRVLPEEKRYFSSFLGTFDDVSLGNPACVTALKGAHADFTGTFTPYFASGKEVAIKLVQLNKPEYEFWKSYEISVSLSSNMLVPSLVNLPSNVQGGKGCWYGMNGMTWVLDIP